MKDVVLNPSGINEEDSDDSNDIFANFSDDDDREKREDEKEAEEEAAVKNDTEQASNEQIWEIRVTRYGYYYLQLLK